MTPDCRVHDLTEEIELEDLVKELDAALDAWFLGEVAPALEEARTSRPPPALKADAA